MPTSFGRLLAVIGAAAVAAGVSQAALAASTPPATSRIAAALVRQTGTAPKTPKGTSIARRKPQTEVSTANTTATVSNAGDTASRTFAAHASTVTLGLPKKAECTYSALKISILDEFEQMIGRRLTCAQVYANAANTWAQWESPWFINYVGQPNLNWSAWATSANTNRKLVITLNLFPSSVNSEDWLDEGAAGDYAQYATVLAQHLVAAGLGNSIIRLAPEMNGTWYSYSLGTTEAQWAKWDEFYAKTVEAMRAVAGAEFAFDWCINASTRALPLSEIYPGDNVVDIIGIDDYDLGNSLGTTPAARWNTTYNEADGIKALLQFARSENKPVSIPEWGLAPKVFGGGGDSAAFVNGIASVVRNNPVVYESYFYHYYYATQLSEGPKALAAYRRHFGAAGDSVDWGSDSW